MAEGFLSTLTFAGAETVERDGEVVDAGERHCLCSERTVGAYSSDGSRPSKTRLFISGSTRASCSRWAERTMAPRRLARHVQWTMSARKKPRAPAPRPARRPSSHLRAVAVTLGL